MRNADNPALRRREIVGSPAPLRTIHLALAFPRSLFHLPIPISILGNTETYLVTRNSGHKLSRTYPQIPRYRNHLCMMLILPVRAPPGPTSGGDHSYGGPNDFMSSHKWNGRGEEEVGERAGRREREME